MPKFVPVIQKTVQLFTNELVIKKSVVAKKKNPFKMKGWAIVLIGEVRLQRI